MIVTRINDHTVKLTPDTQRGCVQVRRPKSGKRNTWEGKVIGMAADVIKDAMEKQLWLARQMRRSDDYQLRLERRGCHKSRGLGGWSCPSGTKVMRPS